MRNRPIPTLTKSDLERFWAKVEVRGADDCWEWTAYRDANGYGKIGVAGKACLAHRLAYFIEYNIDPVNQFICHACDNPSCCNPAHLWPGTNRDNIQDASRKGRISRGEHRNTARLTEHDVRDICRSTASHTCLAKRYGVSPPTVGEIKRGKSWKHVPGLRVKCTTSHLRRNGKNATLTEQDVEEIRASNESQRILARRYGVSQSNISKIRLGKTWKE